MIVKILQSLRAGDKFRLFWQKYILEASRFQVNEPTYPHRRKVLRRSKEGRENSHSYPSTPEDHYRQIHFEVIDLTINWITDRFNQPGFLMYVHVSACGKSIP